MDDRVAPFDPPLRGRKFRGLPTRDPGTVPASTSAFFMHPYNEMYPEILRDPSLELENAA
ncbi:hypothetical protein [Arthrobacter sp. StoSoilB22]|uniref:hypothetical protein n=1 Tax=Arthrobacter sp. StoSoilB22 TaxID=2830996 RepID=UPI001CC613F5|nr:hypothetical protein [Arthrobacter sp. StoSoilB22]BCW62851.1 hypothetical protein StoSoilB22_18240 [Arthrobacter sp. StoSoilB22]